MKKIIPVTLVENKIYLIRGQRVMLDSDLAKLYQVETRVLIQAVQRNKDRFPNDFMFEISKEEFLNLRSQIVISSYGGRRYLPYVFTEHGVTMLSSVLKSKKAIQVNIAIVRAFIKLREILATHKDIIVAVESIKREQEKHGKQIVAIIDVINKLLAPPKEKKKERIGFYPKD
jgi:hypothetical protein